MFVQPRTSAKLKNRSLGKTTSSQPIAKPFVNCWLFFAFCVSKNLLKNRCQITGKCLLKINVENIFCRKKELAVNVEYLRRQGIHCLSARYKSSIENTQMKLTTKSQIYKCQLELQMPCC
jgi:hypothetical protein